MAVSTEIGMAKMLSVDGPMLDDVDLHDGGPR
jgi:hypothetical protein